MENKTLVLIMAAGKGARISSVLNEDEPIKPMIRYNGQRLIEHVIKSTSTLPFDKSVLSFDSPKFDSLDKLVKDNGLILLKQRANQGMPMIYVLARQYYSLHDPNYFKQFDHIMMMPSDVILEEVDLEDFYQLHIDNLDPKFPRQVTMLCADGKNYQSKVDFLRLEGNRVVSLKKILKNSEENYISSYQAGIHLITKAVFENPIEGMLKNMFGYNFNYVRVIRYATDGRWKNFGNLDDLLRYRKDGDK